MAATETPKTPEEASTGPSPEWGGLRVKLKTLAKLSVVYDNFVTGKPINNVVAGHKDQFLFTKPGIVCKKSTDYEKGVFETLMKDPLQSFVPRYHGEVHINGEVFLEMQDLLFEFQIPTILDIKMGSRTFLESEVKNQTLRPDLLQKMIEVDPKAPTEEEVKAGGIKKLRYMQFREQQSSTMNLGFRIEGMKLGAKPPINDFKTVKTEEDVTSKLLMFLGDATADQKLLFLERLENLRTAQEQSQFFMSHQLISSSLLFAYDRKGKMGVWMIDFAKTIKVVHPSGVLTHRKEWVLGNEEDGYLWGLDNLISLWKKNICKL
eukprot:TRINITY_DN3598_c0_g2_i1.p1 TRINITY_DN3598_c0_g2~~TRINITY_DN3598_c0_g2_i1.p1  ORF type:complete len:320 (+),score=95.56 TRINITY_DN3598_c0_g2_i1:71-1030(+)